MSLEIIAAKDFNHAFEIVSIDPEKRMEDHVVSESEEIGLRNMAQKKTV